MAEHTNAVAETRAGDVQEVAANEATTNEILNDDERAQAVDGGHAQRQQGFPAHDVPRVWFITSVASPVGISVTRKLLEHGDIVVGGVGPSDLGEFNRCNAAAESRRGTAVEGNGSNDGGAAGDHDYDGAEASSPHVAALLALTSSLRSDAAKQSQQQNLRLVALDTRALSQCQSSIAETMAQHGRLDVLLLCTAEAVVGTVEELSGDAAQAMARAQFEAVYFGSVNVIAAALPVMRARRDGHLVVLTGTTAHLGTPGLGIYCAAQWALEGYCDSLAYEVAPFNIRTTIVQPNVEVGVLTNKILAPPAMREVYGVDNGAPLFRDILSGLLGRLDGESDVPEGGNDGRRQAGGDNNVEDLLHRGTAVGLYPRLSEELKEQLVAETVHALISIGGHPNPPSRHIVGHEGVTSVKEKLKTVSEEMEDFVEASASVDI